MKKESDLKKVKAVSEQIVPLDDSIKENLMLIQKDINTLSIRYNDIIATAVTAMGLDVSKTKINKDLDFVIVS